MIDTKIIFIICFLSLLWTGCKKNAEPNAESPANYCMLYKTLSADTNYIPHHRNNVWDYCSGDVNRADYDARITWDTVIGNSLYFDRVFHTSSSHAMNPYYPERWRLDPAGNYYRMTYWSAYKDTLLLIKPSASDGDTLWLSPLVILINKNETVESIPGCYHVVEKNSGYDNHHYYKKGLGELYFTTYTLSKTVIY